MKYCSKCGSANPEDAVFCAQCGTSMAQAPQAPEAPQPAPAPEVPAPEAAAPADSVYNTNAGSYFTDSAAPSQPVQSGSVYSAAPTAAAPAKNPNTLWLILNIVATLCCCLPVGVAGIVFAALGTGSYNKGDYADSDKKANIAKILFIVGVVVGIITIVIGFATGILSAIANGDFNSYY